MRFLVFTIFCNIMSACTGKLSSASTGNSNNHSSKAGAINSATGHNSVSWNDPKLNMMWTIQRLPSTYKQANADCSQLGKSIPAESGLRIALQNGLSQALEAWQNNEPSTLYIWTSTLADGSNDDRRSAEQVKIISVNGSAADTVQNTTDLALMACI